MDLRLAPNAAQTHRTTPSPCDAGNLRKPCTQRRTDEHPFVVEKPGLSGPRKITYHARDTTMLRSTSRYPTAAPFYASLSKLARALAAVLSGVDSINKSPTFNKLRSNEHQTRHCERAGKRLWVRSCVFTAILLGGLTILTPIKLSTS